CFQYYSGYSF
nr:immunoglobulin light chain junction region [Macaca mulatta]MOV61590.1 immunoglobulin light chain junction region [Macaca mulatta]MOV62073.1 immunoglobulin light chain junction region [Macaca mulatta]MOV62391.1 immunoglobulin light chain junction region [Macaca mulatta]MOV62775.1 immunoglobulin light chain junction region [Macaca mulatta]